MNSAVLRRVSLPSRSLLYAAGAGLLLLALAFLAGAVLALGIKQLTLLLFGAVGAGLLLVAPPGLVLWVLFVLTFLVIGNLQYFAKIDQVHWIPYLIGGVLYLRVFAMLASRRTPAGQTPTPMPALMLALFAFFICMIVSAALNASPTPQVLVGAKNYVFIWSVMFLIGYGALPAAQLLSVWRGMFAIALVQLPVAAYQHFFVAAERSASVLGGISWDSVVGTFGGDPDGGGASGAMALFLVIVITFTLALWKRGLVHRGFGAIVILASLVTILLAEVKIFFVLLPLAIVFLFWRQFGRQPIKAVAGFVAVGVLLAGLFLAYEQLYWKSDKRSHLTTENMIDRMLLSNFDPSLIVWSTGEVGRTASVVLWWRENVRRDPLATVIGHGPMASRISRTIGYGEVAKRYPFQIALYTAPVLLWDLGIIGFSAFALMLALGARRAFVLARDPGLPAAHAAAMESAAVALLFILVALPYNRDAVDQPSIQTLLTFLLGYVVYWHNTLGQQRSSSNRLADV